MTLTEEQPRVERHASWLELFFDLTVVAAAIQVSHRLHDAESLGQVAACGAVFYAVWSVWTAFSVYVNVAGERTRERSLLVAMFGMCVMVASVSAALPEVLPEPEAVGGRTVAFTVAFIMCRSLAALPAHLLVTAGTIGIATGLGLVTMHAEEVTSTAERWYLFGGLAAYPAGVGDDRPSQWRVADVDVRIRRARAVRVAGDGHCRRTTGRLGIGGGRPVDSRLATRLSTTVDPARGRSYKW